MQRDQPDTALLDVRGMWCTSCANALERTLQRQPGVLAASVSFAAESASVQWTTQVTSLDELLRHAQKLGYECVPEGAGHDRRAHFARVMQSLQIRLVVAVFFSMWVMPAQWTLYMASADTLSPATRYWLALFAGLSAAPVLCYCAVPFFRAAWRTLRARAPGMDFLVAIGAGAAYLLSIWQLFHGAATVYFDSAVMIITFLLAGRLLETTVRSKSSDAVRSLLELPPETAHVIGTDGAATAMLAKRVKPGDTIRILPGERVPLDGAAVQGTSTLDRSLLTGESSFIAVGPGDFIEAGATNGAGELIVSVQRAWGDRRVDLIARSVRQMLARKTAGEALAERFTRYLAPAICILAALTLLWNLTDGMALATALEHAVAVLVVTCPCALGMAVPLALTAGAGRAARVGVLFRDVEAIEKAGKVTHFFFDKTGTLTEGAPQPIETQCAEGVSEAELIASAAIAERGSEHPLAKSISALVPKSHQFSIDSAVGISSAIAGAGVRWTGVNGTCILTGSAAFLAQHGIAIPAAQSTHTAVHIAKDGTWRGALYFADAPRAGARQAIARLRNDGAQVAMLTGDDTSVGLRIGRAVGIDPHAIYANQSPEAKAQRILETQASGFTTSFVGDGLNDAPALAAADLGIAVGNATASSVAAASIVLVNSGVEKLRVALAIARQTARTMRENLVAAAIYNLLAIPLAVAGVVSPAMAAALMIASSLSVTLNSSRLASSKIKHCRNTKPVSTASLTRASLESSEPASISYKG